MTAGLDPRYERRARFWMRAFPPRYRAAHGEELLSTLADVEAGRKRPRLRTAYDLVRAGWGERIRSHPPATLWVRYCLGGKLPDEYLGWMLDDVQGWYGLRCYMRAVVMYAVGWGVLFLVMEHDLSFRWTFLPLPMLYVFVFPLGQLLWVKRNRDRTLKRHGVDATGAPLPPAPPVRVVPMYPVTVAARARTRYVPAGWSMCIAFVLALVITARIDAAMAAIALGLAVVTFAVARTRLPSWQRAMRTRAEHAQFALLPKDRGLPLEGVLLVAAGLFANLMPLAGAAVIVAGGAGPALLALGYEAERLEHELGRPVPTRLRTRMAPAPPDTHELA